jgi:hypothetical protein
MCRTNFSASVVTVFLLASMAWTTSVRAQSEDVTDERLKQIPLDCTELVAATLQIPASSVLVTTDHYNEILSDFCADSHHRPNFDKFVSSRGHTTKYSDEEAEFLRALYCRDSTGAFWEGYYEFRKAQDPKMVSLFLGCEELGLHWVHELRFGIRSFMPVPPTPQRLSLVFTLVDQEDPDGPPSVLRVVAPGAVTCSWVPVLESNVAPQSAGRTEQGNRAIPDLPATDYALDLVGQTVSLMCETSDEAQDQTKTDTDFVVVSYTQGGVLGGPALPVPWPPRP